MIFAEEHPLDPATLTAIRTAIAAGVMLIAIAVKPRGNSLTPDVNGGKKEGDSSVWNGVSQSDKLDSGSGATAAFADEIVLTSGVGSSALLSGAPTKAEATPSQSLDGPSLALLGGVLAAGVELGMYLFAEVATESVGLQLTSATRAGFLTQSTAVLTPVLAYLAVRLNKYG